MIKIKFNNEKNFHEVEFSRSNNTVTLRDRDTMEQIIINLDEVEKHINERIKF